MQLFIQDASCLMPLQAGADEWRADLLLVDASSAADIRLVATIAAGKPAYCAEPARVATSRHYPLAA